MKLAELMKEEILSVPGRCGNCHKILALEDEVYFHSEYCDSEVFCSESCLNDYIQDMLRFDPMCDV